MQKILIALLLSTALVSPTLAQDLSCADFMAMDAEGQMAAMTDAMTSDDAMAADGAMATNGAMAADGAMAAEGAMGSDDVMASDVAMPASDARAGDEAMAALVTTCRANPDMMVSDVMGAM